MYIYIYTCIYIYLQAHEYVHMKGVREMLAGQDLLNWRVLSCQNNPRTRVIMDSSANASLGGERRV